MKYNNDISLQGYWIMAVAWDATSSPDYSPRSYGDTEKMGVFATKVEVRYRDSALSSVQDRKLYFVHHIHSQLRASGPPR
jgi:hypothetical protein